MNTKNLKEGYEPKNKVIPLDLWNEFKGNAVFPDGKVISTGNIVVSRKKLLPLVKRSFEDTSGFEKMDVSDSNQFLAACRDFAYFSDYCLTLCSYCEFDLAKELANGDYSHALVDNFNRNMKKFEDAGYWFGITPSYAIRLRAYIKEEGYEPNVRLTDDDKKIPGVVNMFNLLKCYHKSDLSLVGNEFHLDMLQTMMDGNVSERESDEVNRFKGSFDECKDESILEILEDLKADVSDKNIDKGE